MNKICQKDFPFKLLGESKESTIADYGCLLCSIAMIIGYNEFLVVPLNKFLVDRDKDCFAGEGSAVMNMQRVADALGYTYRYSKTKPVSRFCIAEYADPKSKSFPQHFFVLDCSTGMILDPLTHNDWEKNKYTIASYRILEKKESKKDYYSFAAIEKSCKAIWQNKVPKNQIGANLIASLSRLFL